MSATGEGIDDPNEGAPVADPAPELEGDVPKPAFELPDKEPEEPAAPKNAKERHSNRGYAMADVRRELERERTERQRFAEQLAELRGQLSARPAAPTPTSSPLDDQLKSNRKDMENALDRMSRGDTAAVEEWHRAREKEQRLISRAEAEEVANERAKNAPRPMDPVLAEITAKHPWLQTDEDAKAIAEANVRRLVRKEGRDMSNPVVRRQTLLQAAAEAARDLELGGEGDEPTEPRTERYRGVAGQSSGAGRSGKTVVSLTGEQKAQAEALFRHLEPEAAHREWFAKIGARIQNK